MIVMALGEEREDCSFDWNIFSHRLYDHYIYYSVMHLCLSFAVVYLLSILCVPITRDCVRIGKCFAMVMASGFARLHYMENMLIDECACVYLQYSQGDHCL